MFRLHEKDKNCREFSKKWPRAWKNIDFLAGKMSKMLPKSSFSLPIQRNLGFVGLRA
jgi:hypothetical protein